MTPEAISITIDCMGMFDHLKCDYPLPARPVAQSLIYQTKSVKNIMDELHIHQDGSLWAQDYDIEDHSDPDATGIAALAGTLTRVNVRPVFLEDFSGPIVFYGQYGDRDQNGRSEGWLEFEANFINGQLKDIKLVNDTVPGYILAQESALAMDQQVGIADEHTKVMPRI